MIPVFMKILSMSAVGNAVILAVLLGRLLLKKAPRAVTCVLWLAVLFRLLCPWSPESRFGGISRTASAYVETMEVVTLPSVAGKTNNGTTDPGVPPEQPAQAMEGATVQTTAPRDIGWREICCGLWLLGMSVLAVYSLVSLLRLKRRLVGAVRLRDNIYLADHLETAFVLGLARPKIYLPSSLSQQEQDCILAHEQTHIRRGDPWWKALAFLALTVHWFNPLVWLAFVSFGKDMETACDEAVVRKLGPEIEADYAASLLRLATGRRILAGAPLAFGEGDTSGRIRHILRYKKPAFWVVLISVLAVVILGLFLTFDRTADTDSDYWNARYTVREVRYDAPMYNFAYTEDTAPEYAILPDGDLYARDKEGRDLIYGQDWTYVGTLASVQMDRQERNALFDPSNNTVQEIMYDVTAVYEVRRQDSGATQELTHYLMVTRQGQLYLTVGSEDQVRWLFRLEYAASVEEYELRFPVRQSSSYPINVSDGLCVRGASWVSVIWPELYPDGQIPVEDKLPSISLPIGQQMLILDLEDLDSRTLTVGLSPNGGAEETTVLNRDSDGSFYWFLPEAQTMRCRVIFEDCCYAFRVETEEAAETHVGGPYADLAYDLTEEGSLTLPVSQLTGYSRLFRTNSTKIKIKNCSGSASLHVEMLTPESREDHIMLADVEPGKSVSFTNLTAAQVYALRITGDPGAEVTISD